MAGLVLHSHDSARDGHLKRLSRQTGGDAGGSGLTSNGELGAGESFVGSLAGDEGTRRVDGLGSGSGREAERRHLFLYQVDVVNPIAVVEAVEKAECYVLCRVV
jgi:hypothetical protein